VLEYEKTAHGVSARVSTDWYVPNHRPDPSAAAVLID